MKKTSKEWSEEYYPDKIILDPDGWDRSNFKYSFEEELITEEEFLSRLGKSTVMIFNIVVEDCDVSFEVDYSTSDDV